MKTNKYWKGLLVFVLVGIILHSCKKINEFDYVEDYEGNFNFFVTETLYDTHPDDPTESSSNFEYYGIVQKLRRDEIEIVYSTYLPYSTICYDREYYYMHTINALVDKSGKLTLPCTEGGDIQQFTGQFVGLDTLKITVKTRLSEFTSLEHKIVGSR
ncbi:MAG: hypothetical protein JXB49_37525 [Bacteroidales bacterium]|nr:hypothetical protein [Bacteroidales bacterium]